MIKPHFKNSIYFLVIVSILLIFVMMKIKELDFTNIRLIFEVISTVVAIDILLITIFTKWIWKYKIFQNWLVPFPNLNGSWKGHIYSNWINPETKEKPSPIPVILNIKQSFFNINCKMITEEMESNSYAEGFILDSDKQIKNLAYSYTSNPKTSLRYRSTPHDGTIVFKIIEKPVFKLEGRYWTERETTGEIKLEFYSKEIVSELPNKYKGEN